jgi:hypothetical protein
MAAWTHSAQDGGVASDDEYDWADDPALSPDVIRARVRSMPKAIVVTSREALRGVIPMRIVYATSNTGSAPARVLSATTSPLVRQHLVSPAM